MDKLTRLTSLHRLFAGRRTALPLARICERFECSPATAKRAIRELRDDLGAPLHFDRQLGGYRYAQVDGAPRFELPGLWFGPDELAGLATLQEMLARAQPGIMSELLAPLARRLDDLMARHELRFTEAARRIRVLSQHARSPGPAFAVVAHAVIARRRVTFRYGRRSDGQESARLVSPQRLTRYRGSWYLDAWCHDRTDLRVFSLERISGARILSSRARSIPDAELDDHYADSYGIFSGRATDTAILRVAPHRARWVADELWHPRQRGSFLTDGSYELHVPFRHAAELIMDILRLGSEVEVVQPPSLRATVAARLREAVAVYERAHKVSR